VDSSLIVNINREKFSLSQMRFSKLKSSRRRRREHGAGTAKPADDVGAVSGRTVSAGAQVAPSAADAGNRCRECHGELGLRPGGLALRSGRGPLLPATAAAATLGVVGRSSPSSVEPGGVAGRRRCPLQEQQHRGLEAESEAASGGLRARQARVK